MTSYFIKGSVEAQEKFIQEIVVKNNIPSYLNISYSLPFSIKDAHSIKTHLSIALGKSEKRLIVIPSEMSLEAQNALLKIIEELDESTFLIIREVGLGELLPTILSRVSEVRLENSHEDDAAVEKYISDFLSCPEPIEALRIAHFLSEYKGDGPAEVMKVLRNILKENVHDQRVHFLSGKILEEVHLYYKNNLHKRFFWDRIFLSSLQISP